MSDDTIFNNDGESASTVDAADAATNNTAAAANTKTAAADDALLTETMFANSAVPDKSLAVAISVLAIKFAEIAVVNMEAARERFEDAHENFTNAVRAVQAAKEAADETLAGSDDADTRSNRYSDAKLAVYNAKNIKRELKHALAVAECKFQEAEWDANKAMDNAFAVREMGRSPSAIEGLNTRNALRRRIAAVGTCYKCD
jgi:hypothetical protein